MEGKGFRDEFQKFENQNIVILGVSADPVKKQKSFWPLYEPIRIPLFKEKKCLI